MIVATKIAQVVLVTGVDTGIQFVGVLLTTLCSIPILSSFTPVAVPRGDKWECIPHRTF